MVPAHEMLVILVVDPDRSFPLLSLPVLRHLVKDIDLVIGCLDVMLRTLLDLERYITIILEILCEPNGREMTPS